MHDILEGTCHYEIINILKIFVMKYKFFSFEKFNNRVQQHNFGPLVKNVNRIQISSEILEKDKLRLSASEMLTFFKQFSIIIGDLVPDDCKVWRLYILMRQIISIMFFKICSFKNSCEFLRTIIDEHNQLYLECFPHTHLQHKFHLLIHYPRIMK